MTTIAELRQLAANLPTNTETVANDAAVDILLRAGEDGEIDAAERAVLDDVITRLRPFYTDTLEHRSYAREIGFGEDQVTARAFLPRALRLAAADDHVDADEAEAIVALTNAAADRSTTELRLSFGAGYLGEDDAASRGAMDAVNLPTVNVGVVVGSRPAHEARRTSFAGGLLLSFGALPWSDRDVLLSLGARLLFAARFDVPLGSDTAFRADVGATAGVQATTDGDRWRVGFTVGPYVRLGFRAGPVTPYIDFSLVGGLGESPNDARRRFWNTIPERILNGVGSLSLGAGVEVPF